MIPESVPIKSSLITAIAITLAMAVSAPAQSFNKTFTVPDASSLEIINQTGGIRIIAGSAGKIVISAKRPNGEQDAKIDATQPAPGKVKVEVTGRNAVDFEIIVPASSDLDLLCYKCSIAVAGVSGSVRARSTEGQIQFTGLRSPRVEAHSTGGDVSFSGDVLPSGNYTLKSFSGRVDATLPANADFKLSAASYKGGIDLGGFQFKFDKQTDQLVEGVCGGSGKAAVLIWTQEGSIHLHRKP